MTVFAIGEARRRLPELVRRVVDGRGPVAIGRRGRPEAVLVPAPAPALVGRRPLVGLIEIVGEWAEAERVEVGLRDEIQRSLERTARLIAGGPRRRRRRRLRS